MIPYAGGTKYRSIHLYTVGRLDKLHKCVGWSGSIEEIQAVTIVKFDIAAESNKQNIPRI